MRKVWGLRFAKALLILAALGMVALAVGLHIDLRNKLNALESGQANAREIASLQSAGLQAHSQRLSSLESTFASLGSTFEAIDESRVARLEDRLDAVEDELSSGGSLDSLGGRLSSVEDQVADVESNLANLEDLVDSGLRGGLDDRLEDLEDHVCGTGFDGSLEDRIGRLEAELGLSDFFFSDLCP